MTELNEQVIHSIFNAIDVKPDHIPEIVMEASEWKSSIPVEKIPTIMEKKGNICKSMYPRQAYYIVLRGRTSFFGKEFIDKENAHLVMFLKGIDGQWRIQCEAEVKTKLGGIVVRPSVINVDSFISLLKVGNNYFVYVESDDVISKKLARHFSEFCDKNRITFAEAFKMLKDQYPLSNILSLNQS